MKRLLAIASVLACMAACSKGPGQSMRDYVIQAEFAPATRLHLEGTSSPLLAGRYWKWSGDDVLTLTYSDGEEVASCGSSSVRLDSEDGGYAFFTFKIPSTARALSIAYGSDAAFGKICGYDQDIPGDMVYAKANVSGEAGEQNLPAGVLQHCCSYLLIYPAVSGQVIRSIVVSGTAIKGTEGWIQTITVPVDSTDPFWLALCNEASGVSVYAVDGSGQSTTMAVLDDLGQGTCQMYEISYKPVIDYRQ